jgi:hypothetical protein
MEMLLLFARTPQKIHSNIPPWLFWAIWLGFLGLFVLMLYAKSRAARKRREAFEQFAMESGFAFSEKPDEMTESELREIRVASVQMDRRPARYTNVLRGSAGGGEAIIADRTVGQGKGQSTSTIVAFKFDSPVPPFMLCPENVLWHIAEKFGYKDIDIDGAPEFSRRFFLHGDNETAVRALFKPEVTQVLEQMDTKKYFVVSAWGEWLVVYRSGRLLPVQELRDFLGQAELIANAFRRARSSSVFR